MQSSSSDPYNWRNVIHNAPDLLTSVLQNFPEKVKKSPATIKRSFQTYFESLQNNASSRFKSIALCIAFLFFAISILAASNPFKLLVPGKAFVFPYSNTRQLVTQYGVSKKDKKIVEFERYFLPTGSIEQQIRRIAGDIQTPVHFKDKASGRKIIEVAPLPALTNAIIKIWFLKENGLVIIDLRSNSIERELNLFLANAPDSRLKKSSYLDSWFIALTSSILKMHQEVKAIEYRLDGQKRNFPEMTFNLVARYK